MNIFMDLCDLTPCWRKFYFNTFPEIGDQSIMVKTNLPVNLASTAIICITFCVCICGVIVEPLYYICIYICGVVVFSF